MGTGKEIAVTASGVTGETWRRLSCGNGKRVFRLPIAFRNLNRVLRGAGTALLA